ncbi:T9SS type A sorting domain-containing protein [Neolewinella sp.]|uniref:T9SS type A sorting domain-containing protein n=1 Tax=Neolewinella sp. TaxID=2993543 RepID=UPI003B52C58D
MKQFASLAFFLLLCTCGPAITSAQQQAPGFTITCGNDGDTTFVQDFPVEFRQQNRPLTAEFIFEFTDSVPEEARIAIRFAGNVWGSFLQSAVPINVAVDWRDRGDERLLASAGPTTLFADFTGAPDSSVWYVGALVEALTGQNQNDTMPDINVVVNSTANWAYNVTGPISRARTDMATVMIHELGHGLGFLSSIRVDSTIDTTANIGFLGDDGLDRFIVYDKFLETPPGLRLVDTVEFGPAGISSTGRFTAIISQLDWAGDSGVAKNGGELVPLFAPSTFDVGSSVSHTDESAFLRGTPNALMTPQIANGEVIREPGQVNLGIFFDMGWPLNFDATIVSTGNPTLLADRLGIYPNPTASSFVLPLGEVRNPTTAVLFDAAGRQARRMNIENAGAQVTFSVEGLATGVYNLFVPDGDRAFTSRVVVR